MSFSYAELPASAPANEKQDFKSKYTLSIDRIKTLLEEALVGSDYTDQVTFDAPERIGGMFPHFAVTARYANINGTSESIRVVQPHVQETQCGLYARSGSIESPLGQRHLRADSVLNFSSIVEGLARNAGLRWPIRLKHPPPVGTAPFDPYRERYEDYLVRYQMNLDELVVEIERKLREHGYEGRYTLVRQGEHTVCFEIEPIFHPIGIQSDRKMIQLTQPTVQQMRSWETRQEGVLTTPYLSAQFESDNYEEVFERVIADFVFHERPDVVAEAHARLAALETIRGMQETFPSEEMIDSLVADVVHRHTLQARAFFPGGSKEELQAELIAFRKAFANRILNSKQWGDLPSCRIW